MTPPLPKRPTTSPSDSKPSGRVSDTAPRINRLLNLRRYGIWSLKTKAWLYTQPKWNGWKGIDCVYKTKREAARDIRECCVHEQDYEVRLYHD